MLRQAEGIDPNKQYTVDYDEKRHRESISLAELEEENKRIGAAVARLIQMHGKGPAPQASSTISDLQNHSLNAMQALEQIAEEKKLGSGSGSEPRLECGL
jgi:thioesterase domain-containing protein